MCERCQAHSTSLSRRGLLAGAGAFLAAGTLPVGALRAGPAAQEAPPPSAIPPAEALDRLMQGNARYAAGDAPNNFSAEAVAKTEPHLPIAALLACSDSPVPAELLFDRAPGDLFVIRNAGSIVTDTSLASLEYAIRYLSVPLLMVLSHTNCGAVATVFDAIRLRTELPGHLSELVKAIEPAVIAAHAKHPGDMLGATIEENVRINVKRLIEAEPIRSEAIAAKQVAVSGGVHDLASGKVSLI